MVPTPRFLALPLIALAIIVSLPAPKQDANAQGPVVQRAVIDCGSQLRLPACQIAQDTTQRVTR